MCGPNPLVGCNAGQPGGCIRLRRAEGHEGRERQLRHSNFGQIVADAIANAPNTLFVFAAGNGGSDGVGDDNDATPDYPCNYPAPNIICVAATDHHDNKSDVLELRRDNASISPRPGNNIVSTFPDVVKFRDGFEADNFGTKWTTGGTNNTWARQCVVGDCFMTDSPAGIYRTTPARGPATWLRSTRPGTTNCHLQYLANWILADDSLTTAGSTDAVGWTPLAIHNGSSGGYQWTDLDGTGVLDGLPSLYLRWWLISNASANADGAVVDYIAFRCRRNGYALRLRVSVLVGHLDGEPARGGRGGAGLREVLGRGRSWA